MSRRVRHHGENRAGERAGGRASEAVQAGCNSPWLGRLARTSGKAVPGTGYGLWAMGYGLLPPTVYRLPLPRTGPDAPCNTQHSSAPALQRISNERPVGERPNPTTRHNPQTRPHPTPRGRRERANAEATGSHPMLARNRRQRDRRRGAPAYRRTCMEQPRPSCLKPPQNHHHHHFSASCLPASCLSRRLGPPNAQTSTSHAMRHLSCYQPPAPVGSRWSCGRAIASRDGRTPF